MSSVFIPVFRFAISYSVNFGRRWTALEHMILLAAVNDARSAEDLSTTTNLPVRLVVEALINLLRIGWIEIRMTNSGALFKATVLGSRRAADETLPSVQTRKLSWTSMCRERLTGAWLRTDDLELVHESDLPPNAFVMKPTINTFELEDGILRNLVYIGRDETFESFEPTVRAPAVMYARVNLQFGETDLPPYAPIRLQEVIRQGIPVPSALDAESIPALIPQSTSEVFDALTPADFIVGGPEHKTLLLDALHRASTFVIIHSCFLDATTVKDLSDSLVRCALRGVRVELLWGLHSDPEDVGSGGKVSAVRDVLRQLPEPAQRFLELSPDSSGSHAKILLFDSNAGEQYETVIGSCNFLSTSFDWLEMSLRTRSLEFGKQVISMLLSTQLPSSGSWSPVARRLENIWNDLRRYRGRQSENGPYSLTLLVDDDHYACITRARDEGRQSIDIGCDLYGLAAETSALVPLARAAELGSRVTITYHRPTEKLTAQGRLPNSEALLARGLNLRQMNELHGKYLLWDTDAVAMTSFNWLSTVVDGTRVRGNELGVLVRGPELRSILSAKLPLLFAPDDRQADQTAKTSTSL
jgi:phosphatidylserine/phosphatidylglycerophosphate/cardiolipin synthase-like enzyme